jgi:hypothetical protein
MFIEDDVEAWLEDNSELKTELVLMIKSSSGSLAPVYSAFTIGWCG